MTLQQILGVASKSLNEVLGLPSKLESLLGVNTGFMKPGLNQDSEKPLTPPENPV
jgi:hypothetical protein